MRFSFLFSVSTSFIIIMLVTAIYSQEIVEETQVIAIFNTGTNITMVNLINNISESIVVNERSIITFDYHLERKLLFWASESVIYRSCTKNTKNTSSKREVLVIAHVENVGGLCVDWIHDRLYWTDVARGQVETASLDGNNRSIIYKDGKPISISVDPVARKLFWLDDNPFMSKIRYTWLDGSYHRQGFAWQSAPVLWESRDLDSRSSLVINPYSGDLYFTRHHHDLTRIMLANQQSKTIKLSHICSGNITQFALLGDKMFWTNTSSVCWNENRTVKNELQNCNTKAKQVKIFSSELQISQTNVCEEIHCAEECFDVNKLLTCACNFGSTLKPDSLSCDDPEYYLVYTTESLYRMTLRTTVSEPFPKIQLLWYSSGASIFDVAIHIRQNLIFWTDNRDKIVVSRMNRPWETRVLVNCTAKSVTVDWIHDLLYWTENTSVMVSTLDGKVKWQVAEDPNKPFSLVVDPINRLLFWSTCGWEMMIVSSALDGSARRELVTSNISCATSLSVDSSRQRLYWVDRTQSMTSSIYYDGQIRHNTQDPRVKTVSVFDNKLIWTSTSSSSLFINENSWSKEINLGFYPSGVVVFSNLVQPEASTSDSCRSSGCQGLCIPGLTSDSWRCVCSQGQYLAEDNSTCHTPEAFALTGSVSDLSSLSVREYNSSSVTLLVDSTIRAKNYIVSLEAINSYQTRDLNIEKYKVKTQNFPLVVSNLRSATVFSVRVEPQPTYLGVWKMEVSTSPPPLEVIRLPLVYKPWDPTPIPWLLNNTADHFDISAAWQPLIKEFILLMFSSEDISTNEDNRPIILPKTLLDKILKTLHSLEVKDKFVVIKRYENIMEFDQDPEMHLTNTPFGTEFYLKMCQVSEYRGSFRVDFATTEKTEIPWPRSAK